MLNRKNPEDLIIMTGISQSLCDLGRGIFAEAGLNFDEYLEIDKSLYRKNETISQLADISKAKKLLSWNPKYVGEQLAKKIYQETYRLKVNYE